MFCVQQCVDDDEDEEEEPEAQDNYVFGVVTVLNLGEVRVRGLQTIEWVL